MTNTATPSANDSGLNLDHLEAPQAERKTIREVFEHVGGHWSGSDNLCPTFGSAEALRVYTVKMQRDAVRAALANQPAPAVPALNGRITGAHACFSEAMPPGSLTSIGHANVYRALQAAIAHYVAHQPAQEQAEPDLWVQYIDGVKTQNVARDAEEKATVERMHRIMAPGTAMTWRAFFAAQQEPVAAPQQAEAPKGGA
jgi:hypothetical protein